MTNAELLTGFYAALNARDGATMAAAYAPSATFTDPAFGLLKDGEPAAMWKMLTSRSKDLRVDLVSSSADETTGAAHWVATYTFGATGNRVVNDVTSTFAFAGGRIVTQVDVFDFRRWAGQALGLPGKLLGWAPPFHAQVTAKARAGLTAYVRGEI